VHFLNIFQTKQYGQDHLVVAMQMLILPILAHAFQNGQSWEVVDAPIVKTIVDKLLDPPEEVNSIISIWYVDTYYSHCLIKIVGFVLVLPFFLRSLKSTMNR
jgi:hypothetical protein